MLAVVRRSPETTLTRQQPAAVTPWDPWSEFNRIRSQMDHLFQGTFGTSSAPSDQAGGFTPPVDLWEDEDAYFLNAYLPGLSREDIQLEVTGSTIHISGEAKPKVPEKDATVHVSQGYYGQFDARYTLPKEINSTKVEANYRNGVLEARLPKAESVKPKTIPINIQN